METQDKSLHENEAGDSGAVALCDPPAEDGQDRPKEAIPGVPAEIDAIAAALVDALVNTDYSRQALCRQAQLLDTLLYKYVGRYVEESEEPYLDYNPGVIELALKIQTRCTETLKAAGTIEYMKALTPAAPRSLPPTPLKNGERNE